MNASLKDFTIRALHADDVPAAMRLVWSVFERFEAPEYPDEGVEEFKRAIDVESVRERLASNTLELWGGFLGGEIAGVMGVRNTNHICMFFVDAKHHRKGIARSLFELLRATLETAGGFEHITVNSSPYAVEVYHRLGFEDTAPQKIENGLIFTPMRYSLGAGR